LELESDSDLLDLVSWRRWWINALRLLLGTLRLRIRFLHDVLFWASLSASGTDRCSVSQSSVKLSVHLFRGPPLGLTPLMWPWSS